MRKTILATALLATVGSANAADGWTSSVELGTVLASGNTQTQSLNAKGSTEYVKGKSRTNVSLSALNVTGKVDGQSQTMAQKVFGNGKSAYQYSKHSYGFIAANGIHDKFSGFAYQISGAAGYGFRILDTAKYVLDLEAGPGYRQTRLSGVSKDVGTAIAHVALSGKWTISKTSFLTEDLSTEGSDYWLTNSVTALSTSINSDFSMKFSLTVKNNSQPPAGKVAMDTQTAVTLVYTM